MDLSADGRSQSIRSSTDDGKPSRSRPQERQNASVAQTTGDSRGRMTNAQIQAQFYLNDKKIFELFNFLIGHLLVDEPSDPIEYLHDLLDKCMLFRAGLCDPPLLFTERHVESMFRSLDPAGIGHISLEQYKAGMTTLGIVCYETNPKTCSPGRVDKQTFEDEATKCLISMLSEMIGKKSS